MGWLILIAEVCGAVAVWCFVAVWLDRLVDRWEQEESDRIVAAQQVRKSQEKRMLFKVGHIPPANWPCDWVCQVGAVSADSEATADRMAEERYVMRPGFELELLPCQDEDIEEAKRLVFEWHDRNDFFWDFCRNSGIPF